MKTEICKYLSEVVTGVSTEEFMGLLEIPPEEKMGDYALPCFALAKKMHKNPALIAQDLMNLLDAQKEKLGIDKVQNVGAYCNIYLDRALYASKHNNSVF